MDVLLVMPPNLLPPQSSRPAAYRKVSRSSRRVAPMGLCSVAAVLRQAGIDVTILDAEALDLTIDQIADHVREHRPRVVGSHSITNTLNTAYRIFRAVKDIDPDIVTIIGGPQPTAMPAETADHPALDVAVIGEAEPSIVRLVNAIDDRRAWRAIPGLAFRDGDGVVLSGPRERIGDINDLPFPARDLLPMERYYNANSLHFRMMNMMTQRGCRGRCIFCRARHMHAFQQFRPARVVDEMELIVKKYGFREVAIYDDTFTIDMDRAAAICEEILRRGLTVSWWCATRVDKVTLPLLRLMKRAGCYFIHFGVESGTQRILDNLRKDITLAQARDAVRWAKRAGLRTLTYFMLGCPGETRETVEETMRFSREVRADFCSYAIATPWPGCDMGKMAVEQGIVPRDYWPEYVRNEGVQTRPLPNFAANEAGRRYLQRAIGRAFRDYYLRPRYVMDRALSLRSLRDFAWHARYAKTFLRM